MEVAADGVAAAAVVINIRYNISYKAANDGVATATLVGVISCNISYR